ncbi:MAG: Wzz/FepE/Etk N-terminal domain-containing protein, partial [Propionibacteriaceae bacterium]|nr:Wzz/FepE/Etk N-terminal domain-containing protein [Propionibacteriaceae bacterium]
MDLAEIISIFRQYWRSIAACTLVGITVAVALVFALPKTYTAQAQVFLAVVSANTASEQNLAQTYLRSQVDSFARVARSPQVLDPVISELGLSGTSARLASNITVSVPSNTVIIVIDVNSSDGSSAASIANAVGNSLIVAIEELVPSTDKGGKLVKAVLSSPALVPTSHSYPQNSRFLMLGILAGLAVGVGQAFLRFLSDNRIRGEAGIAQITDTPIIGRIGSDAELKDISVTRAAVSNLTSEDYRRLRTNL